MRTARATAKLLTALLLVGALLAVPAGAMPAGTVKIPDPSKFKIKTKIAKLEVDVAGYVETRRMTDTVSDCFPGEHYIQTNTFTFETGRYVDLSVKSISAPGLGTVMTSRFSKAAGTAKTVGKISDYRATNHCAPQAPAKLPGPPPCVTNAGKLAVALTPGDESDTDAEVVSLAGRPLLLSLKRTAGGTQPLRCAGEGAQRISGKDTRTSVIGTSLAPGVSEVLPARLDAVKVFNIRAAKRMRRVIVISGSCAAVTVNVYDPPGFSPDPGALNADGDCRLTGKIVLNLRSRR